LQHVLASFKKPSSGNVKYTR